MIKFQVNADQAEALMAVVFLKNTNPRQWSLFVQLLCQELERLRRANDASQSPQLEWQQGACQLLSSLLDTLAGSGQLLKALKNS